ncbi:ferric reductase-like transmembrane domain-containing protein [Rhabdaerophilum sp. SD176]|uniref:sulfite oxidase heme-binding subunit YedZ n=1 Tax=Rhabdaerophilum sp. SD176 TaxID=2983548 RepID=UPI0024DF36BE|nr:ferric reductase-like transmembrane domain-containing protein [Rhabdaerophilum sp. SD176]
MSRMTFMPVFDRQGRFSSLKAAVLIAVILPGLWISWRLAAGQMGAKPITAALHETGLWSVRLLLVTLLITPLRAMTGQNRLLQVRRMLGVSALAYALIHLGLYVFDLKFDLVKVASEIVLRFYLTIGFAALMAMAAMGATSFDSSIRKLGAERWNRLHSLIYPLALLTLWHGALQSKIDASEHIVMTGLFLALIGARFLRRQGKLTPLWLLGLAIATALATSLVEFGWYALATGFPAGRVFAANLSWDLAPRPALIAGLLALSLPLTAWATRWFSSVPKPGYTGARQRGVTG